MSGLVAERAAIITSTLTRVRPDVFLVDHAPLGIKGELAPALKMARKELPDTRVMIGLRDVIDDPAAVKQAWREKGIYEVLEQLYDQVMVYGCQDLYDVTVHYDFSPQLAERTTFTGYIGKDRDLEPRLDRAAAWRRARRRGDKRVLVMGGGGGDAADLFRLFLKAWRRLAGRIPGQVLMVEGPLMDESPAASLERRAAGLEGVTLLRSSKTVLSLIAGADLVVGMGGYNTVVEALTARKPLVLCPRVKPRTEQLIRAELMAELGLAQVVRIERESSKALAAAIEAGLAAPQPSAARWRAVDLGGAARVAEIVLAAVAAPRSEGVAR